jgi:hypothetical protein
MLPRALLHRPSYAFFSGSISIFFIFSIASITRFYFCGSGSDSSLPRIVVSYARLNGISTRSRVSRRKSAPQANTPT